MSAFNRNVITDADISKLLAPDAGTPKTLDAAPPAGDTSVATSTQPAGGVKVPTADDYLTKLLKYVPVEVLGAYLFIEGLVTTNVDDPKQLQTWLFWILVITMVLSAVYARTVLSVVRTSQIAMGAVGIAVYVFATGGWFATTAWYESWFSGIALVLFGFLVAVIKLPSLPVETT
jgi:hypothetical protein